METEILITGVLIIIRMKEEQIGRKEKRKTESLGKASYRAPYVEKKYPRYLFIYII